MKKLTCSLLAVALTATLLPVADAVESAESQSRLVTARVDARPGRTTEMYVVPGGMELLISQVCTSHPAVRVELGRDGQELTYRGKGCTSFGPGLSITSGQTLYCSNNSGMERNCMAVGMLRDDPMRGQGAQFIDVDEAIAEQKDD